MNERTNVRTNERKSENYIPPHTSYVGGYNEKNDFLDKIDLTVKHFVNVTESQSYCSRLNFNASNIFGTMEICSRYG